MIAGPQIISAILLATSTNPRRNSLGYIAGVTVAVTIGTTISYVVANLFHSSTSSTSALAHNKIIDYAVAALLIYLGVHVFLHRKRSEPPKWMGKLQSTNPRFSFKLGFLLFLLMPTDIITMIAVGSTLAQREKAWWFSLPFILLTVLLISAPLLMLLLLGKRAKVVLPKTRDWMNAHSWIISEIVILFFLASTINDMI